tara:strand:+ start:257 stop:571 length:315 start_codon:yes stop_codon:yes gene_type:complete
MLVYKEYICVFIKTDGQMENVVITAPNEIMGDFTICGAFPDYNLVMIKSIEPKNKKKNMSNILKYFNKDEDDVIGDIIVIKTDDNGEVCDFTKEIITYFNIFQR